MNRNLLLSIPLIQEVPELPSDLEGEEIYDWAMYQLIEIRRLLQALVYHNTKPRSLQYWFDETKLTILNAFIASGLVNERIGGIREILKEVTDMANQLKSIPYS